MWKTDFKTLTDLLDNDSVYLASNLNTIIIDENDESFMEVEKNAIYIPKFELELHQGTFWQKSDDGEFYPDWGFTSINKIGQPIEDYLYFEQGTPYCALHNFLHAHGITNIDINSLVVVFRPDNEPEPTKILKRFRKPNALNI